MSDILDTDGHWSAVDMPTYTPAHPRTDVDLITHKIEDADIVVRDARTNREICRSRLDRILNSIDYERHEGRLHVAIKGKWDIQQSINQILGV